MKREINEQVYCLSYFTAKPGYQELLIKALLDLVEPTHAEPGCLQYELLIDNENPGYLIMLEKFKTQSDLDSHEKQPYIKNFVENQMQLYCEKVTWNVARVL